MKILSLKGKRRERKEKQIGDKRKEGVRRNGLEEKMKK